MSPVRYLLSNGVNLLLYPDGLSGLKIEKFISCPEGRKVIARGGSTPYALNEARTNKVCPCHPVTRLNKMKVPILLKYE